MPAMPLRASDPSTHKDSKPASAAIDSKWTGAIILQRPRAGLQPVLVPLTMVMAEAIMPPTSARLAGRISVLPCLATLPKAST